MHQIKDAVVIVTGGAAGIGAGLVKAFLMEGAKHVAALDIDARNGKMLEQEFVDQFGPDRIKFYKCNVTTDDLDLAYESVVEEFGCLDIVVNCAGIMNDDRKTFLKEIQVNVSALVTSSFRAFEIMRKDHGGRGGTIVNISSVAALMQHTSLLPVYGATKSAVLHFSTSLGMEPNYSRSGVRVLCICFGCTYTSIFSVTKMAAFDKETDDMLANTFELMPFQSLDSAVRGLIEAFKVGDSASTWLVTSNKPAQDITSNIAKAHEIMSQGVFYEE